jgi:hypothetical protein
MNRTQGANRDMAEFTSEELQSFREILTAKQADLEVRSRRRDGIAIEKSADAFDEIQYAIERDIAIRTLDRDAGLLRDVRAALSRK